MPAFGPSAMLDMFDGMQDIASQLLLKWERYVDIDMMRDLFKPFTI